MTRSPDRSLFLTGPGLRPKPGLGTLTATRTSLRPASHGLAFLTAPGTSLGYCNVGHFPPLARQREGEGAGEREKGREGGREGEGEGERERETGSGWPRLGSAPHGSHTARPALHTRLTPCRSPRLPYARSLPLSLRGAALHHTLFVRVSPAPGQRSGHPAWAGPRRLSTCPESLTTHKPTGSPCDHPSTLPPVAFLAAELHTLHALLANLPESPRGPP